MADGDEDQGAFHRLAEGRFGRLVLPAIILQSVLIGGGYATGREVVEFGARFGAMGWMSILTIFAGFTVVNVVLFEVVRVARTYDYKGLMKELIGRAWPVFDIVFAAMAILVIAVMASASGEILQQTLGVPYLAGIAAVVAVVGALTYHGSGLIERFKTGGTVLLYLGYALFAGVVIWTMAPEILAALRSGTTAYAAGATPFDAVGTGILYVGYNLAVFPAVLFTLHRQKTRRDTVTAGLLAGFLMTLPFLWTYLAVLAFYPDPAVLGASVPWLAMLDGIGPAWLVVVYGIVVAWTLLETSTGLIHAILDRVDQDLKTLDDVPEALEGGLSKLQSGLLGAGVLVAAALLARVGIIELVATGYTAMAFVFLGVFAVPLFTVGLYKVLKTEPVAGLERYRDSLMYAAAGVLAGALFGLYGGTAMMERISLLVLATPDATAGWVLHLLLSALFGAVYAQVKAAVGPTEVSLPMLGILYGIALWVVGPVVGMPVLAGRAEMVPNLAIGSLWGHILYGAVLQAVGQVAVAVTGGPVDPATGRVADRVARWWRPAAEDEP